MWPRHGCLMALTDAPTVVSKLVGVPTPVLPIPLRGGTRLSGLYVCEPFDGELEPADVNMLALAHSGTGRMTASVEGRTRATFPVTGAITIIPKGMSGRWHFDGRALVSNVFLGDDRLYGCADHIAEGRSFELTYRNDVEDNRLASLMHLISAEVQSPTVHSTLFLEHAIELACLQVLRSHSTLGSVSSGSAHGLAAWQVGRVTQYMRAHLDANMSLDELAGLVGVSRFHFCNAFRVATGVAPYAYLTALRMEAAKVLLRDHRRAVLDVAFAVGYRSQSAFSCVFRKAVGLTPSQYRAGLGR